MDEFRLSSGDLWDIADALHFLRVSGGDGKNEWLPKGLARLEELEPYFRALSREYLPRDNYDTFTIVKVGREPERDA